MILIVTGDGDVHADEVCALLTAAGVPFARFDPACFPREATVAVRLSPSGSFSGELRRRGAGPADPAASIALQDIAAVWWRRPGVPVAHSTLSGTPAGAFAEQEAAAALSDLWELLDVPFIPATPDGLTHAGRKARQLRIAGRLGFELPATLIGNDPDGFLTFHRRQRAAVITKRIGAGQRMAAADGETIIRYADPVRPRDLARLQDIELCPFIGQEQVAKDVELRVTVVGDRVFAAAIHSQEAHHTRNDWRRYDSARTPMQPVELPCEVADRCRLLVRELDLLYGAIDLVRTPDGRYVFLEINPNGQYLWIEHDTGLPISAAVATLLANAGRIPEPTR